MNGNDGIETLNKVKIGDMEPYVLSNIDMQLTAAKNNHSVSTLWISGGPGIGKTWNMAEIAKKYGFGLNPEYMATMLLEQITGLPKALTDSSIEETLWSKPQMFCFKNLTVEPSGPEKPTVLFLDDAHLCNKSIQSYLFQLLTYRGIHHHKLGKNIVIIMAGNRSADKAGFQQILAPVSNRIFFLEVTCEVEDWIQNFAMKNNIRMDIISFLQDQPTYLEGTPLESAPWASPRSWTYASFALDSYEDKYGDHTDIITLTILVSGHVGVEYATKFIEYKKLLMEWQAELLLTSKKKLPKIKDLHRSQCYCLMSACIGEFLKQYRRSEFKLTKELDDQLLILKKIIEDITRVAKEIVPLGLKILIIGEKEKEAHGQESRAEIARKLLTNQEIIEMVSGIVG